MAQASSVAPDEGASSQADALPYKTVRVGKRVTIYTPNHESSSSTDHNKRILLLAIWADAKERYVRKYIDEYYRLFPSVKIVALKSYTIDYITPPFIAVNPKRLGLHDAISAIQSLSANGEIPDIFVHAWSNGGGAQLVLLAETWRKVYGVALPASALFLDSTPGRVHLMQSLRVHSANMPQFLPVKLVLQAVAACLLLGIYIVPRMLGLETWETKSRIKINEKELLPLDAPRVYVYSSKDEVVGAEDVSDSIVDARRLGYTVEEIRLEDTPHVQHMRGHPEMYWDAFVRLWKATEKA
jgi:hypothetical protein